MFQVDNIEILRSLWLELSVVVKDDLKLLSVDNFSASVHVRVQGFLALVDWLLYTFLALRLRLNRAHEHVRDRMLGLVYVWVESNLGSQVNVGALVLSYSGRFEV